MQKTWSRFDQFSETIQFLTILYYTARCKKTWSIFDQVSETIQFLTILYYTLRCKTWNIFDQVSGTIQFLTTLYYTVRCKKHEVNLISFLKPSNFWPHCITLSGAKKREVYLIRFLKTSNFWPPCITLYGANTRSKLDQVSETIQFLTTLYYTVRCQKCEVYLIRFLKPSNFWPSCITLYGAKTWNIFDQVSGTIQFLTNLYYTVRCKKH